MGANTSEFTAVKQAEFSKIIAYHIKIVDAVWSNPRNYWMPKTYLYVDLYAGPGVYDNENYSGEGSPLIAINALRRSGFKYQGFLINNDLDECKSLHYHFADDDSIQIINHDNELAVKQWPKFKTLGIAYFDPNNIMPNFNLAKVIENKAPYLDLLFYFGATPIKRVRKRFDRPIGEGHSLKEQMLMLDKKRWLIKRIRSAQQYVFLLGTNGNFKDWKKQGFHDIDSPKGWDDLNRCNLTNEEYDHHTQMGLI